jgi:hypothetical protein
MSGQPRGFLTADLSVLFLHDPKVRRLKRAGGPEAVLAYLDLVLSSWGDGTRLSVDDLGEYPEPALEALASSPLTDEEGRLPLEVWEKWHGSAEARRDAREARGRRGAEARWGLSSSNAQALPTVYPTDRPSDRPSETRARPLQRGGNHRVELGPDGREVLVPADGMVLPMVSFRDAMAMAGFAGTTKEGNDGTTG